MSQRLMRLRHDSLRALATMLVVVAANAGMSYAAEVTVLGLTPAGTEESFTSDAPATLTSSNELVATVAFPSDPLAEGVIDEFKVWVRITKLPEGDTTDLIEGVGPFISREPGGVSGYATQDGRRYILDTTGRVPRLLSGARDGRLLREQRLPGLLGMLPSFSVDAGGVPNLVSVLRSDCEQSQADFARFVCLEPGYYPVFDADGRLRKPGVPVDFQNEEVTGSVGVLGDGSLLAPMAARGEGRQAVGQLRIYGASGGVDVIGDILLNTIASHAEKDTTVRAIMPLACYANRAAVQIIVEDHSLQTMRHYYALVSVK
ncbi:MAG: hypothetical protein AB1714_07925 [Acidobacteriota bacterium]